MNRYIRHTAWMAVLLAAATGCDSSGSSDDSGGSDMDAMARMLDQQQAAAPEKPATTEAPAAQPAEPPKADAVAVPQAAPPAETERPHAAELVQTPGTAQVIGQRKYRNTVQGPLRYYGAMASARMVIKDQLLWAQIKKSVDLFEATNSRYPKDTEEFMDVIIAENMIELPELPDGQEYFFDPTDHELKIGQLAEQPTGGQTQQQ
jgi:hypothetical protein